MTTPSTDSGHNGRIGAGPTDAGPPGRQDVRADLADQEQPIPLRSRRRRRLLALAIVLGLLALVAGGIYLVHASHYVTTDNAQIDGDQIQINAPATGTLTDWSVTEGTTVRRDQLIARIQLPGSGPEPQQPIRAPEDGTVVVSNAVNGQWVTAGTNLATAYNTADGIYATARVDETDIKDVHVGAFVDISVDSAPDTPVTGIVEEVQDAAAAEFSLFPESNSSGNFQKVTQVIPVKIGLLETGGLRLAPGMNITVHIHKVPDTSE